MYVRSALLSLLTASLAGGLVTPAGAAAPTEIWDVDMSVPGHVSGVASTDAPYARIALVDSGWVLDHGPLTAVTGGSLEFDRETWGLRTDRTYVLRVEACPDTTGDDCARTDVDFTPTDVDPDLTWPTDRVLGPGESAGVTVSDPRGNGGLVAVWDTTADRIPLASGENAFPAPDGRRRVGISRCSHLGCRPTGQSADFLVDRVFAPIPVDTRPHAVHPDGTTAPDGTARFSQVEGADSFTLDWRLVVRATGEPVAGVGGTITGLVADAEGRVDAPLDLTGAPDGRHRLVGELSYDSPDFGHVTTRVENPYVPVIDTTSPDIVDAGVSEEELYPVRDGHLDTVKVSFTTSETQGVGTFEFVDATTGEVVATRQDRLRERVVGVWDGRADDDRKRAPEGIYIVRADALDDAGNTTTAELGRVNLLDLRLTHVEIVVKVTATRSLLDQWTGRCSSVTKGGSRNWKGGLGLASNKTCASKTWRGSGVSTVHGVRTPRGWMDGSVSINAYGGAARTHPGSRAYLEPWSTNQQWMRSRAMTSDVAWHGVGGLKDRQVVQPSNHVYWRTVAGYGHRYDIKKFHVRFEGSALR